MALYSMLVRSYRAVLSSTKEAVIRAMMGVLIFLGYVLLSLFMYAIMRRVMVPQKLHIKPVHLYFHPECQTVGGAADCPFPKAEFLLTMDKRSASIFKMSLTVYPLPPSLFSLSLLSPCFSLSLLPSSSYPQLLSSGQYYHISLQLQAPESPVNAEVGVFMVNITLYTTGQQFLSTSARPAMVKYKSFLLRTLSTIVFAVPLLLGVWSQEQELNVPLYEAYYEPYGDGTISATVSVLNPHVQLYSSTLTIDANFGGLTYYLYQWPVTMTVIVVVSIFISLCTCTLVLWVRDVLRDFDTRRRTRTAALQRRQGGGGVVGSGTGVRVQTQLPGGAGGGGGTSVANAGVHRRPVVIPRPPHSGGSSGTPISGLPPYTPRGVGGGAGDERATPTPSELSESTGVGVEDVTTSSQIAGSVQSEMSSVAGDTDTEGDTAAGGGGGGLHNILHTLRSLESDLEEGERTGDGGGTGDAVRRRVVDS
ncbi:Seipin [Geodia barretti]|uniref:Seipin n=1 Tax=Geodia barretti TaxID=519541 RepID=A0AA35TXB3_GEOBA|nr:Seipin [Geodia barretti]